jgi:hypothetical protein
MADYDVSGMTANLTPANVNIVGGEIAATNTMSQNVVPSASFTNFAISNTPLIGATKTDTTTYQTAVNYTEKFIPVLSLSQSIVVSTVPIYLRPRFGQILP